MNNALLSSKNMCWCTPPDFFTELDREFHFELDPASTDKSAKCAKHFTPDDDGLKQDWGGVLRVLQSTIRPSNRRLGTQRLRRKPEARHHRGYAHSFADGHGIFSRLDLRQGQRGEIPPRPPEIHRRGRKRRGRSSVSFCRHSVAESGKHRTRVCHMAHIKEPEPAGPLLRRFR